MWENMLAGVIVLAGAVVAFRGLYKTATDKNPGCGRCSGNYANCACKAEPLEEQAPDN